MKKVTLTQYVQVSRTVILEVEDDCSEKEAAEALDEMPLGFWPEDMDMPDNATIVSNWDYVSDMGIENADGEVVLNNEA